MRANTALAFPSWLLLVTLLSACVASTSREVLTLEDAPPTMEQLRADEAVEDNCDLPEPFDAGTCSYESDVTTYETAETVDFRRMRKSKFKADDIRVTRTP